MSFFNGASTEYPKAGHMSFLYGAVEKREQVQQVLRDVSMEIRKGEFVALLGYGGSGKSTMAKHFNTVLLPSGGRVCMDGTDTMNENLKYETRRHVGLVLRNPNGQLVAGTVEEDVAFEPGNLGIPPVEIRQRVDVALEAVGIPKCALHSAHKLFGGQKQRAAIVRITAMQPDCIVLDEPTVTLDPHDRTEVVETTRRLNRERGITVVPITHYMDETVRVGRVIVMDSGETLLEGAPCEVLSHVELSRQHNLDVPQAVELLYRLGKIGCVVSGGVLNEEECAAALELLLNE